MFKLNWHIYCWIIFVSVICIVNAKDIYTYDSFYINEYTKLKSNDVNIQMPKTATHYWRSNGTDEYEAIIKLNYNNKDLILKISWNDKRYVNDVLYVNYTINDGKLRISDIRPYTTSTSLRDRASLGNINIKYAVGEDYEIIEEINNSCLRDIFYNRAKKGIEPSSVADECIIRIKKPVYIWQDFKEFDFGVSKSFDFYDDIQVSACGTITSPGAYNLTSNLLVTNAGNCITISSDNVIFNANNFWINSTSTSSGIGIRTFVSGIYINNITINNARIRGFYQGISLRSNNNILNNITIINSSYGVYFVYTSSPPRGSSNTTINNLYLENCLLMTTMYNTRTIINNFTSNCIADIPGANQYYYQANDSYMNNYTSNSCNLYVGDSGNLTFTNLVIRNIYTNALRYFVSSNWTTITFTNVFINGTKSSVTLPESAILVERSPSPVYFRNVTIQNVRKHGIETYLWFDNYDINAIFEDIIITNTTNTSIGQARSGTSNPNVTVHIINGTYPNESMIFSNSYLYRKWKYLLRLNESCDLSDGVRVWAENWKFNDTILNEDFDFISSSSWNIGGDAKIEEGYFYVYAGNGSIPHNGGWISPKNLNFQKGRKYSLIIGDIDNYYSDVNFTIRVCGLNYTYPKRYYGSVELNFVCLDNGILNISVPSDNIGYQGLYFSGITDYLFVFGWDKYVEYENYTNVNNMATLYLPQYVNNMNYRYFYDNYTIYVYNNTYEYIENMTTNRERNFTVDCLFNICWNYTSWGIFIPKGCLFKLKKGKMIFLQANATITSPNVFNLSNLSYNGNNLNVSSRDTVGVDIWFSENGTFLYYLGYNTKRIYQYFMQIPYNITNATYIMKNFSVNSQDTGPVDIQIVKNGEKMFMLGLTNDRIYEYNLTTPYDISTSIYTGRSYYIRDFDNYPNGFYYIESNGRLYLVGTTNDTIYEFNMTIPYNASSLVYTGNRFSVKSQDDLANDIIMTNDGRFAYILGDTNNRVYEYNLSISYNISTANYTGKFLNVGTQDNVPEGMYINFDLNKLWMVGDQREVIYEYSR